MINYIYHMTPVPALSVDAIPLCLQYFSYLCFVLKDHLEILFGKLPACPKLIPHRNSEVVSKN